MMRAFLLGSFCAVAAGSLALSSPKPASVPHVLHFRETARLAGAGANPRRPLPREALPVYYELPGPPASRQGTAFAVDSRGAWATAAHVTNGCRKAYLLVNQRGMPPLPVPARAPGADISLFTGGLGAPSALALAERPPAAGAAGYHMGFPMGSPGLVGSRLLGTTSAVRQNGRAERVLAWVEDWRSQDQDEPLDGLSGGPVLNDDSEVVGIVSMATERRGRILSSFPKALRGLMTEAPAGSGQRSDARLAGRKDAVVLFQLLLNKGVIRQLYCDI